MNHIKERFLSLSEIFVCSIYILKKQFINILFVSLMLYIPGNIILFAFNSSLPSTVPIIRYIKILKLGELLWGITVTMAISSICSDVIYNKDKIKWDDKIEKSFSNWFYGICTSIYAGLIILGLSLLFVFPGIVYYVYYCFVSQAIVLKGLKYKNALKYSKDLVIYNFSRSFWVMLICSLMQIMIYCFGSKLLNLEPIFQNTLLEVICSFFTIPISVLFINIDHVKNYLYVDLKPTVFIDESMTSRKSSKPTFEEHINSFSTDNPV